MAVVKGGVWTNIEDEILKASVSKYGLNQWARVSSLLARKTPKQCKARWSEWLDPSIRKIEWSKEEDEKLLHLAKLMPTQWRTIAPIVGRTATQCLERYQKLLDEAEARENDELGLGGPTGGETAAPSADDVRKLRPGELDPDPESKPARPDTIDLDEDEKEMLSEARARLANTQGKKAKRKARERQLEESRRLAQLQKRRELKNAGINIKVVTRKPGQMDYNADIPFEKAPAPGFYDTRDEEDKNEKQREAFDPRRQQLANKRKQDSREDEGDDHKRRKNDKSAPSAASQAAQKAGQMQKLREAERSSKRRALNLPSPQVGEAELEDIVKMGMSGERDNRDNEMQGMNGLTSNYGGIVGGTPVRTPRAPQEEDRIANEIRNARARNETQSALLGAENPQLYEGEGTTGYHGVTPSKQAMATPNPMATPFRRMVANGATSTGKGEGATPLRTPRDNFHLNDQSPFQTSRQTPREIQIQNNVIKTTLRSKLASLPRPKETDWELELPEEQGENLLEGENAGEDAAFRDERDEQLRLTAEREDYRNQTQVIQRSLPRPAVGRVNAVLKNVADVTDSVEREIAQEAASLMWEDAKLSEGARSTALRSSLSEAIFDAEQLEAARLEVALEIEGRKKVGAEDFDSAWDSLHSSAVIPGLAGYGEDEVDEQQLLTEAFDNMQERLADLATNCSAIERKLSLLLGGYSQRSKTLRQKTNEAAQALEEARTDLETKRLASFGELAAMSGRLERTRSDVENASRRERHTQETYRERKSELDAISG